MVSLVGAGGEGRAWRLSGWSTISREEIAPPIDLFTGKVPLAAGDHVLTVAAERRFEGAPVFGEAPLRLVGRHFVADVTAPDGTRVPLLVDTAAVTSVITPRLLPNGVEPERAGMVEQSPQGRRVIDSVLMGATGEAGGVLGDVVLPALDVGSLHFENVQASVIESLPLLGAEPIAGILGSDLLGRAPVLVIEPPRGTDPGRIELAARAASGERGAHDIVVPITRANGLTWLRARAGGTELHLVLDTGAAATVLPPKSAERAGAVSSQAPEVELHGLSGAGSARHAKLSTLRLGDHEVGPLSILVSDVAVLQRVVGGSSCGVLGLPQLEGAARIVLDLERRELRLCGAVK